MRRFLWVGICVILLSAFSQAQDIEFRNVQLDDASVFPGTVLTAQIIEFAVPSGYKVTISSVFVVNTADGNRVRGDQLEYIEVRRGSETGARMGRIDKETELTGFESLGVEITTSTNNKFSTPGSYRLYIRVKLKANEGLVAEEPESERLALGGTVITGTVTYGDSQSDFYTWVSYVAPVATFTVVGPTVTLEGLTAVETTVYRGQRFLAAEISIDAAQVPFDLTINSITVQNVATEARLSGRYVSRIEVRRASDAVLLGEQTSATELEKFATVGTTVYITSNNQIPSYSQVSLEIWITLKNDAPPGHHIQIGQPGTKVRCNDVDFTAGGLGPSFTVQQEDLGIENIDTKEDPPDKGVVPGETFLARDVKLTDNDSDPYDVILGSILVKNIADSPLADQHVAKIEVRRKSDGAVLGSATDVSGLSTSGVRIGLTANNVIPDDTTFELQLYVTLAETAPIGRQIKLSLQIWYNEGGSALNTNPIESAQHKGTFTVVGPGGLKVENRTTPPSDRNIYPGQSFMAQKIYLADVDDDQDHDDDPYSVTITRILVKNLSGSSPVEDKHVASIQIRDSTTGKVLGETTTISGLTTSGVWVNTTANNTIDDDKSLTIEIWITLKSDVPAGKKITAGARVEHTEGGQTFTKPDLFLSSQVEFTTATGTGRTVSFTYKPDKPKWNDEIEFTPSVTPSTGIVYARWDFGDGTVVERRTAEGEKPLDPIKHTYGKGGEFTVVYAVRDEANRETSTSKKITVTNEPPKNVDFTFSPSSPTVNQTVTFTPSDKTEDPDGDIKKATFRWDFGDGSAAVTTTGPQNVTHTYTQAGTYTVTLTVTDQGGAASTARKEISIGGVTPPAPQVPTVTNVTVSPANPTAGETVTFTATATAPAEDPVTQWEWDFGDNTSSTTETNTATHTYTNPGQYTVRVRAKNNAGWSQPLTRQITVFPPGVTFGFLVLDNPVTGNQCRIQIFAPAGATDLKITIFDQAGRPVILNKSVSVGTFTWDLKDQNGRIVPNGLYLFYITAKIEGQEKRTEIGRILVRR